MKRVRNNTQAFTLLELIIVIIVTGVLAALAVPRFFSVAEYSRAIEAFNNISSISNSIVQCAKLHNGTTGQCGSFSNLDIDDPGLSPGAHFTYRVTIDNPNNLDYTITAYRNALNGGTSGDQVQLVFRSNGSRIRSGTGAFHSIK